MLCCSHTHFDVNAYQLCLYKIYAAIFSEPHAMRKGDRETHTHRYSVANIVVIKTEVKFSSRKRHKAVFQFGGCLFLFLFLLCAIFLLAGLLFLSLLKNLLHSGFVNVKCKSSSSKKCANFTASHMQIYL